MAGGNMYDVVIIGGGPAGLTAALYLARAKYRVVVVEKDHFGGQITITSEVVNYPGIEKTDGKTLTETMRRQAQSFGAEFMLAGVTSLQLDGDIKQVFTTRGTLDCFGILVATGAKPRMIGFKGESDFRGHGVAYCATCDGEFFTGKEVFVVGGGFAAAEESVFLTKYATHVTILIRGKDFSCAEAAAEAARNHPKITVLTNTQVEEVTGDASLNYIRYRNSETGEVTEYRAKEGDTFGVFVFAGYEPATNLVANKVERTPQGYIVTDPNQKTNVDGLYAAGDVCVKPLRQVVTAVGDGALAATELEKYAAAMQKKTGIRPKQAPPQPVKAPEPEIRAASGGFFSGDILNQLNTVFSRMTSRLILELYLDSRPVSGELKTYMTELAKLTDKLTVRVAENTDGVALPFVKVLYEDGTYSGLGFHGVPGGHEFTSFVLGLYNAGSAGQPIDSAVKDRIHQIDDTISMKLLVSLSCTMCPELVTAAQRVAAENEKITAEVYDINHFADLRHTYNVMSVPCLVIEKNGKEKVSFGKKNIVQLLDLIALS